MDITIIVVQKIKKKILIMVNHKVMENMVERKIMEENHTDNTMINIMHHLPIKNIKLIQKFD
jgi:hypothetical protein